MFTTFPNFRVTITQITMILNHLVRFPCILYRNIMIGLLANTQQLPEAVKTLYVDIYYIGSVLRYKNVEP